MKMWYNSVICFSLFFQAPLSAGLLATAVLIFEPVTAERGLLASWSWSSLVSTKNQITLIKIEQVLFHHKNYSISMAFPLNMIGVLYTVTCKASVNLKQALQSQWVRANSISTEAQYRGNYVFCLTVFSAGCVSIWCCSIQCKSFNLLDNWQHIACDVSFTAASQD